MSINKPPSKDLECFFTLTIVVILPKKATSCIISIISRRWWRVVLWRMELWRIEGLIWELSWRRYRPWIDCVVMITECTEVVVQHIKALLKVNLPVMKLLVLLLCGQGAKL
jgi:hypothetical protein